MEYIDINKEKKELYRLTKPGKYIFFLKNYSGKLMVEIKSAGVEAYLFGIYEGKNKDNFQLETVQRHMAPGSFSELLIKGVFNDESKFNYQGLIKIDEGADKTHAYQKNQNLIFGEKCFVQSKPYLEILANDVFCTHGSTTGKLDQEQINYLLMRGIDKVESEKLLVKGFVDEIYQKVIELKS